MIQQGIVKRLFPRQRPFLGAQHLMLEFLQFRDDVAFGALEGLAAQIVGRHRVRLGATDFDVVAMHPVEPNLESLDAGTLPFPRLQFHQKPVGVFAQFAQLIQFCIVAGGDDATVAQHLRRVGDDRPPQQIAGFGMRPSTTGEVLQQICVQQTEQALHIGQAGERVGQGDQIARTGRFQRHPRQNPFHVASPAQQAAQVFVTAVVQQLPQAVLPLAERVPVAQRAMGPAPQQPSAHRRHTTVQQADQGMFVVAAQAVFQFQITAAGGVQNHAVLVPLDPQSGQVRQCAALGVLDVLQQATGGGHRDRLIDAAETVQITHAELGAQRARGTVPVEMPGRLPTQTGMVAPAIGWAEILADQQFGRFQALQLVAQRRLAMHLDDGEPAAAQVEAGQSIGLLDLVQRDQQVIAAFVQQRFVGQRAGGDDAHHPPFHRPLAGGGIAHLLADCHRQPQLDQLGQIAFDRVKRYAGHRDGLTGGLTPAGQGDVEQFGGAAGIVVEQFVEIPHPVKHQNIGVFGLDAQVLLHHRRVLG